MPPTSTQLGGSRATLLTAKKELMGIPIEVTALAAKAREAEAEQVFCLSVGHLYQAQPSKIVQGHASYVCLHCGNRVSPQDAWEAEKSGNWFSDPKRQPSTIIAPEPEEGSLEWYKKYARLD